jgi:hypothetical protein
MMIESRFFSAMEVRFTGVLPEIQERKEKVNRRSQEERLSPLESEMILPFSDWSVKTKLRGTGEQSTVKVRKKKRNVARRHETRTAPKRVFFR